MERISKGAALDLYENGDLLDLGEHADRIRKRLHPESVVTFVVDRNINYTNVCINRCRFCAFYRDPESPEAYVLGDDDLFRKIEETIEQGGTQIVLLHAFFLAAIQILVYAGAVMVLFLFVIMLLDLKAEERQKLKKFTAIAGFGAVAAILFLFFRTVTADALAAKAKDTPALEGSTAALGKLLFTQYMLPFEIVSLLLLVGMIGVILLSKKDLK